MPQYHHPLCCPAAAEKGRCVQELGSKGPFGHQLAVPRPPFYQGTAVLLLLTILLPQLYHSLGE